MKLVIAATGASGTIYLQRLLEQIDCRAHEVHLVMSAHAQLVAKQELENFKIPPSVSQHPENDLNVPFVSGSARFDAMVIVPCSMATLGRIASGSSDSALLRAADVFLKERRKLILVPRETPWSLIHARNAVTLLEAGAIVLPAIPSFYSRPDSVTAVVDTVVWRILDQIGLSNPALIVGAVTRQNLLVNLEDRRSTCALAARGQISRIAALGAHAPLRNRRSRGRYWKTGGSNLHRCALA
jgi:4-hydroxy-3-polyprenylbenzoate decarboxylase